MRIPGVLFAGGAVLVLAAVGLLIGHGWAPAERDPPASPDLEEGPPPATESSTLQDPADRNQPAGESTSRVAASTDTRPTASTVLEEKAFVSGTVTDEEGVSFAKASVKLQPVPGTYDLVVSSADELVHRCPLFVGRAISADILQFSRRLPVGNGRWERSSAPYLWGSWILAG